MKEENKKYHADHIRKGLCVWCNRKAEKGTNLCINHSNKKTKPEKRRNILPITKQNFDELKNIDITGKERIPAKDMEDSKFYYEAQEFTSQYGLSRYTSHKQAKFYKSHLEKVALIKMEMGNGLFREFLINESNGCFTYKRNLYVLDTAMRYFIIERNIWAYDFHEFIALPLRKKYVISEELEKILRPPVDESLKKPLDPHIDVNEIKTLIENSELVDVERSINPTTLKRFTDSEVIKQVLQGAMLSKIFKIMFILIIVIVVFMLILIIVSLYSSGLIEKAVSSVRG